MGTLLPFILVGSLIFGQAGSDTELDRTQDSIGDKSHHWTLQAGIQSEDSSPPKTQRQKHLEMFARAYYPGRSGQIMLVPVEGEMVLEPDDHQYRFMHGSPWTYDAKIPLVFFGPGFIRQGQWMEPVVQQDIATTLASLLDLSKPASMTGRTLSTALLETKSLPRAILLVVLDGMRFDYLDRYTSEMPTITRLRHDGSSFENTRVNYLPTLTSVGHATIVTGADPKIHGIAANTMFDHVSGRSTGAYPDYSPANLMALTLGDLWNLQTHGRSVIIAQGTTARATIPLAGHGGCMINGHPTLLAMFESSTARWLGDTDCYRLPSYLRDVDASTLWTNPNEISRDYSISSGSTLLRTPLFPVFQVDALVAMIQNERVGVDAITDLVFVNFKTPDYVGHQYGPNSHELRATLATLDEQLGRVIETLDAQIGADGYVIALTADHGMPSEAGNAWHGRHYTNEIVSTLHDQFDPDGRRVVLFYGDPADNQIFVDTERAEKLGLTLDEMAAYLETLPFISAAFTETEVASAVMQ
jgi:hypothetical protein